MIEPVPHEQLQRVALAALVLPTLRGWAKPGPGLISRNGWLLAHELEHGVDAQEWACRVFRLRGRRSTDIADVAMVDREFVRGSTAASHACGGGVSPWAVRHRDAGGGDAANERGVTGAALVSRELRTR